VKSPTSQPTEVELRADLAKRLQFEILLADLSARFVGAPSDRVDQEIEHAQRTICERLGLDHSSVWQSSSSESDLLLTHVYRDPRLPPRPDRMGGKDHFPWVWQRILNREIVCIPRVGDVPPEATTDKKSWQAYSIKSALAFPLSVGDSPVFGLLSFEATRHEQQWPESLRQRLQLIAQVLANALAQKRTENAFRETEARLGLAAACANAGLWTLESVTGRIWATEKSLELYGLNPGEECDLARFMSLVHPDDRDALTQIIDRAMNSGDDANAEYRIERSDGTVRWIASRGRRHSGNLGERDRLMGMSIDITDRKQAEQARFMQSAIVESSDDAIISLDLEGMITSWNRAAERIYGFDEGETIGQRITLIVPFELRDEEEMILRRLRAGARIEHLETVRLTKQAKRVNVSLTVSPVKDWSGRIVGVSKIARDITEQKRAEAALRKSEERFRFVTNAAPVMIWMSGADKLRTFFNQGWLDFTGRPMEQELGEGWSLGVHPGDLTSCLKTYSEAFDAHLDFQMEYRLRRCDGEFRWIVDHGAPRFEADGSFVGYIGSCVDISESKRAQGELQKSYAEVKDLKERLQAESDYLQEEIKDIARYDEIVGQSLALLKVLRKVEQVAPTDSIVLITGETGTGKELVARAIHNLSRRKDRVMVKVDCAALPATLIESELFGREKGAYTGALTKQIGRFETADGSTLFLDEIGDLGVELQAKLLRVVQDGQIERLGSPKTTHVDVRIIAATHRDLAERVKNGAFREDLFYRLNVFPIHVPPLRERPEDVPLLVRAFLNEFEKKMGKKIRAIPNKTLEQLQEYPWPGNIRELRNVLEHAVIVTAGDTLNLQVPKTANGTNLRTLKEAEYQHILSTLEKTGWRIKGPQGAAILLGMKSSTLYTAMRRLNIPTRHEKDGIQS
jgi:formate hydrogenlyase transcriptional activator